MRLPRIEYWLAIGSMLLALAACAGANGDPAPAAVEAGAGDATTVLIACVDAGATDQ